MGFSTPNNSDTHSAAGAAADKVSWPQGLLPMPQQSPYHMQGPSANLYRSQLDQVAVRSRTEERLRMARRDMAQARALEAQLEMQVIQFGL